MLEPRGCRHKAYHNSAKSQHWETSKYTQVPYYHRYLTRLPSRIPARARTAATTQKPNRDGTAQMSPHASGWWKDVGCFPLFGLESRQPFSAFQALKDQSQPNKYSPSSSQVLNTRWKNHNQQPFSPLLLQTGSQICQGCSMGWSSTHLAPSGGTLRLTSESKGFPSQCERETDRDRDRECVYLPSIPINSPSNPIQYWTCNSPKCFKTPELE